MLPEVVLSIDEALTAAADGVYGIAIQWITIIVPVATLGIASRLVVRLVRRLNV